MDKEQTAIARLQAASEMSLQFYKTPLVVTTSGGKDSTVCVALAERAGIPFEVIHNHTTVDAPETVYFVREDFGRLEEKGVKCTIDFPVYKAQRVTMWSLIPQKLMPPPRVVRYCCAILKERGGNGRFITTGVRWAESSKRKGRGIYEIPHKDPTKRVFLNNDNDDRRRLFETCTLKAKRTCNPIIDWTDADVWDYIESEKLPVNPLYKCGFSRVGCVGCPMAGTVGRQREFARYPKYQAAYIRAFARMLEERKRKGRNHGIWDDGTTSAEDVFHWCPYCYARRINTRFHYVPDFSKPQFFPERLEQLKSKTPAKVFLSSMSDPADWRPEWVDAVVAAIEENSQHEYLLLSKRPEAYSDLFPVWRHQYGDLKNIWYGVTVTSYRDLHKIADLPLDGKRFISFEPLLGSADPRRRPVKVAVPWIDWAIIGAETGPGASASRPRREWVDELVSYCDETGVPVFMKDSLLPVVGTEGMRRDFPQPLMWI